jgi:hypothetical protein
MESLATTVGHVCGDDSNRAYTIFADSANERTARSYMMMRSSSLPPQKEGGGLDTLTLRQMVMRITTNKAASMTCRSRQRFLMVPLLAWKAALLICLSAQLM